MRRILVIHCPTERSTPGNSFGPIAINATTPITTSSLQPISNMSCLTPRPHGFNEIVDEVRRQPPNPICRPAESTVEHQKRPCTDCDQRNRADDHECAPPAAEHWALNSKGRPSLAAGAPPSVLGSAGGPQRRRRPADQLALRLSACGAAVLCAGW